MSASDLPLIVDGSRGLQVHDFLPANDVTFKLTCCLEAIRDLRPALEPFVACPSNVTDKRRVKSLAPVVFNFVQAIDDLFGGFEALWRDGKCTDSYKRCISIREKFRRDMPIGKGEPLKLVRDKIGAHLDKYAVSDAVVWECVDFGLFLHICIRCLREFEDFLTLDRYVWTCHIENGNITRTMSMDGTLVDLANAGTPEQYISSVAHTGSPLESVAEEAKEVVHAITKLLESEEVVSQL